MKEYVIYCKDGVVIQNEEGNTYWSWEFETMDKFGKEEPSKVAKHLLNNMIHDNEIGFELIFVYDERPMKEII